MHPWRPALISGVGLLTHSAPGTVVDQLAAGGEELTVGDQRYVRFDETCYQPIEVNGQPKYEIVQVQ